MIDELTQVSENQTDEAPPVNIRGAANLRNTQRPNQPLASQPYQNSFLTTSGGSTSEHPLGNF
ncbi:MAG: hypothetical protein ACRDRU_05675 [Pseudonocardiaceae bacterium]